MTEEKVEVTQQMLNDAGLQHRKIIGLERNQLKKLAGIYLDRVSEKLMIDFNYFNTQLAIDDYMLVIRWIYNFEKRSPLVKRRRVKKLKQAEYDINFNTEVIWSDLEMFGKKEPVVGHAFFESFAKIHNERADIQLKKVMKKYVEEYGIDTLSAEAIKNLNQEEIIKIFRDPQQKKEIKNYVSIISEFAYMDIERKIWITMKDSLVRSSHKQNHGVVRTKGAFPNGQKYPRDMSAPIKEWINCRCMLLDWEVYKLT